MNRRGRKNRFCGAVFPVPSKSRETGGKRGIGKNRGNFYTANRSQNRRKQKRTASFDAVPVSNPHTKDVAILKLREGRYCERTLRPGGVSFTYNNPAARISLQSKLATVTKTDMSKHVGFCHALWYQKRCRTVFLKELCLSKASILNGFGRFVLLYLIHLLDLQYGTEKDAMFIEANVIKNL